MAVSGLAIPPDQNLSHSWSTSERIAGVSIPSPSRQYSDPLGPPATTLGRDPALVPHAAQHDANPIPGHAGTVDLNVRNGERSHPSRDSCLHEIGLRATAGPQRADPLLKLAIRPQHDTPDVAHPGERVVPALVPPPGARLQRFVIRLLRLFHDPLQTDV